MPTGDPPKNTCPLLKPWTYGFKNPCVSKIQNKLEELEEKLNNLQSKKEKVDNNRILLQSLKLNLSTLFNYGDIALKEESKEDYAQKTFFWNAYNELMQFYKGKNELS